MLETIKIEAQNSQNTEILRLKDDTKKTPNFGEVFITNDELNGAIDSLKHFKGKLFITSSGGYKKLFIIEEG
jgi:hypothetical protein